MDGHLDGIMRVMTKARSQVSAIVSVCVFNVIMSGPEGQISEIGRASCRERVCQYV